MEGRGIPAIVLGTDEFVPLARAEATARSVPDLPVVTVPHPIGGIADKEVARKAERIVDAVLAAATGAARAVTPVGGPTAAATPLSRLHAAPDDLDAYQAWMLERGWGDGLPVLPATPERVRRILAGTRRTPEEVVGVLPPRLGEVTVEVAAVNAALAGAGLEHLPVILAALEALADPAFNLKAVQTTTHPCTPLLIVNGPVRRQLQMNAAGNVLGQGTRANAVIGRAVRLTLQNAGGARPGKEDRATQGHPGKFAYCAAENEEGSPWEPLSVERGFAAGASTVTVCGSEGPHNINDHGSTTPEGILATVAGSVTTIGSNNVYLGNEPLLILGPEHAATAASSGWSKAEFKERLFAAARIPIDSIWPENLERFALGYPEEFRDRPAGTTVGITRRGQDVMVVVAGGAGKHSVFIPTFGATRSVTRPIEPWT